MIRTISWPAAALFAGLLAVAGSAQAQLFGGDKKDEGLLWKSGPNQYIRLAPQDTDNFGRNDHPVELDAKLVATALEGLRIESESFFATKGETERLFSIQQVNRLAEHVTAGLEQAQPEQDVIFVLEKATTKLMFLEGQVFTAGRIFYKDGKLNIIIGEFDKFRNREFERVYDSSGTLGAPYTFNFGSRSKSSGNFKKNMSDIDGLLNKGTQDEGMRRDWLVIDIQRVARAANERRRQVEGGGGDGVDSEEARRMRLEAARMKKEQRELKLEMARMREQIKSMNGGGGDAVPGDSRTVEQRLTTLEKLLADELISREEYEAKRREILSDI